ISGFLTSGLVILGSVRSAPQRPHDVDDRQDGTEGKRARCERAATAVAHAHHAVEHEGRQHDQERWPDDPQDLQAPVRRQAFVLSGVTGLVDTLSAGHIRYGAARVCHPQPYPLSAVAAAEAANRMRTDAAPHGCALTPAFT